jgi:hypothetical protein
MIKNLIVFLSISASIIVNASDLPEEILVTAKNKELLHIDVQELNSGTDEANLYQLSFPKSLNACLAGRVQTFLLKDSDELTSSSMDYTVGSDEPTVLFHMPTSGYDMALTIQYCCSSGTDPGCQKALSIPSIRELL